MARKRQEGSVGLNAPETIAEEPDRLARELIEGIESDGGAILARYREPLGAGWLVLAALPIDQVQPTPFQRDLSEPHVRKLAGVMEKVERYLDPIITVRTGTCEYQTPNGHHRLGAARRCGMKSIVAIVVPEPEILYRILALNTEKAHGLKERALEVIRMAVSLADASPHDIEEDYAFEFEEPPLLTLGLLYEENRRFSGSAYHPILKRVDGFLPEPLPEALELRRDRADKIRALDAKVVGLVDALKAKGLDSPYLKNFVVARINPLRFKKGATMTFDECFDKMIENAEKFDVGKIKPDDVGRS